MQGPIGNAVCVQTFFQINADSANQVMQFHTLIVMGVSGCGKSSVAQQLVDSLGWTLHEGDAYHSEANVTKMREGVALTDEDRADWLARLVRLLADTAQAAPEDGVVLTCSALKRKYRDQLRDGQAPRAVGFVFLDLDYPTALQRVRARASHFFSPELVASQFATLERPDNEPGVLTVDATLPLTDIVQKVSHWMGAAAATNTEHQERQP
jgi:gluconokinase